MLKVDRGVCLYAPVWFPFMPIPPYRPWTYQIFSLSFMREVAVFEEDILEPVITIISEYLFSLTRSLTTSFCLARGDLREARKHRDQERQARKRVEQLASFKRCFGDLRASLLRTCVLVQCASRNLVHGFDAKVNAHPLHNGDDHNARRGESSSITMRLWSQLVNSRQHGYLKVEEDNFKDCHAFKDLGCGETQVSRRVTEKDSGSTAGITCLGCLGRPVCISAERF